MIKPTYIVIVIGLFLLVTIIDVRAGQEVSYSTEGTTFRGFLAMPTNSSGNVPGILVVHEWWGHNDYARKRADMLADSGYAALAVDMYGDGQKAKHSFTNPGADAKAEKFGIGIAHDAEADKKSWQDMIEFFEETFGN